MIQTGSRQEEFGWHSRGTCLMPMSSEKFATLHSKKKKSVWNCFSTEEEGDSFTAYFNDASQTVSNLSPCLWFHVGLQIPVCVIALCFMFWLSSWVSVNLHNDMRCRDLMTAIAEVFLVLNLVWWLHSCINSSLQLGQSDCSVCGRGEHDTVVYVLEKTPVETLLSFSPQENIESAEE